MFEKLLVKYLPKAEGYQSQIMEAMEYSVMAGGKRLRPMLMQETYRMFGGADRVIEPFMAAIEMIHTSSLVHDDLPCMDDDMMRRGQASTWAEYGEDMGVLAGDAWFDAEQWVGTVFALVEGGFADCAWGVVCGHRSISLKFCCLGWPLRGASPLPQVPHGACLSS